MPRLGHYDDTLIDAQGNALGNVETTIYREGATVDGVQGGSAPLTVLITSGGKVSRISTALDAVFINTARGTTYSAYVQDDTHIVLSGFIGTVTLDDGDRLIPSNNLPPLFYDEHGLDAKTQPIPSSTATGRTDAYLQPGSYDVIHKNGAAPLELRKITVVPSAAVGQVRYADEYAHRSVTGGIQEAINDLGAAGGIVQLSANTTYVINDIININVSNVWLRGMGPSSKIVPSNTFPAPAGGQTDGLIVNRTSPLTRVQVTDLTLDGLWSTQARATENMIQFSTIDEVIIERVIATDGNFFGISVEGASKVVIADCIVYKFRDSANSNGISVVGVNFAGTGPISNQATITGNVVENCGTIGIDIVGYETVTIVGNTVKGCMFGIDMEGTTIAAGQTIRNVTMSGNTLIGTTQTNTAGQTQNSVAFILWLRDTAGGGDSSLHHYNINITGNTIKDYKASLHAGGGHWRFGENNIYNYGELGADTDCISVGVVFGTAIRTNNVAIENNYFHQANTNRPTGTSAVIGIRGNAAVIPPSRVRIHGNWINGQDLTDAASLQHGIFMSGLGDDIDISSNYFRGTTHAPIRVFSVASLSTAPTRWNIANNYFVNCNNETGGAAGAYISITDSQNYTWSRIAIVGNVAFDINSRMTSLFANSGNGWTGALRVHNNIARDVTSSLLTLVAPTNLASAGGNVPEAFIFQTITAAGDTILSNGPVVEFVCPAGTTTMTSVPTIADGYHGQLLRLVNVDSADSITLQDQNATLANSNLFLATATITIPPHGSVLLMYSGTLTNWVQVGPVVDAL